jgi:hypothetical protein
VLGVTSKIICHPQDRRAYRCTDIHYPHLVLVRSPTPEVGSARHVGAVDGVGSTGQMEQCMDGSISGRHALG